MAKKAEAESTTKTPRRQVDEKPERGSPGRSTSETSTLTGKFRRRRPVAAAAGQETRAPQAARPSALLDTRVVYCGDNLEPQGRMQNEEGRMMKLERFPILHSSFILLNSLLPASHCVKVVPDERECSNQFSLLFLWERIGQRAMRFKSRSRMMSVWNITVQR